MGKTLKEAQEFVDALAGTDTWLGGILQRTPFNKNSLAWILLQFADPQSYLKEMQELLLPHTPNTKPMTKEREL